VTAGGDHRRRTAALDGLRALAALSVLGYHAWLYTRTQVTQAARASLLDDAAHELRLGLVLFFVLSGFLLYAPWVRSALAGTARPRVGSYLLRRVARIMPAYYAAVVGSVVMLWGLRGTPGVRLPDAENLWLFGVFAQNLRSDTLLTLDPPLWTLAVEWSFYLLLPALGWAALALRGRGRDAQVVVPVAFLAAGVAWNWAIAGRDVPLTLTKVLPAMAPYFALGMLAAVAAHGRRLESRTARLLAAGGALLVVGDAAWAAAGARDGSHDLTLHVMRDLPAAAGGRTCLAPGRWPASACGRTASTCGTCHSSSGRAATGCCPAGRSPRSCSSWARASRSPR
jgi:peptidoglycan/LPS O-acetylase OafA/YrhL